MRSPYGQDLFTQTIYRAIRGSLGRRRQARLRLSFGPGSGHPCGQPPRRLQQTPVCVPPKRAKPPSQTLPKTSKEAREEVE